jgi:hypothetical protein
MGTILSLVLFFLLFPLFVAIWKPFFPFLGAVYAPEVFLSFSLGFMFCFVLGLAARGPLVEFMETVAHETIHALVALPFRGLPTAVEASSDKGGETEWQGAKSANAGCLIAMAPYTFPLLTLLLLPLALLTLPGIPWAAQAVDMLIGGTLALHYIRLSVQMHPKQTDWRYTGFPSGVAIALTSQLVWLVLVLGIVAGNPEAIADYFTAALVGIPLYYGRAWEALLAFPAWLRSFGVRL